MASFGTGGWSRVAALTICSLAVMRQQIAVVNLLPKLFTPGSNSASFVSVNVHEFVV